MAIVPTVEALLARSDIDLVVVSSPDQFHAEHAIAALRAGKHVVVDKPFATTLADANNVARQAELSGRMLTVFHNRRWDADFRTLQRLITEDRFGRIVQFGSHFDRWRPETAQVWKENRAGGSWQDLGPDLVDQAICLFGMPKAITADIAPMRDGGRSPDWFHAVLHYKNCRAILHSSKLAADHRLRFAVHGTRGSWIKHGLDTQEQAIVDGASPGDRAFGVDPETGLYTPVEAPPMEPLPNERGDYGLFWRDLALALEGRGPNPVSSAQALLVMRVLEAGSQSSESARSVTIQST